MRERPIRPHVEDFRDGAIVKTKCGLHLWAWEFKIKRLVRERCDTCYPVGVKVEA